MMENQFSDSFMLKSSNTASTISLPKCPLMSSSVIARNCDVRNCAVRVVMFMLLVILSIFSTLKNPFLCNNASKSFAGEMYIGKLKASTFSSLIIPCN